MNRLNGDFLILFFENFNCLKNFLMFCCWLFAMDNIHVGFLIMLTIDSMVKIQFVKFSDAL
ncbi:hypothetical protein WK78_26465 [Burkholderia cepacia]|nr:hypothetical protein WK78_26465 [Burkholderia cepacia]